MTTVEQTYVLENLSLADNLARKKSRTIPRSIDFEEIQSAAYYGLVEAALAYNTSFEVPFIAYAILRINGSIQDFLRKQSWGPRGSDIIVQSLDNHQLSDRDYSDEFDLLTEPLTENQRRIVELYYLWGFTQSEIGNKMGLNESRICQILSDSKKSIARAFA